MFLRGLLVVSDDSDVFIVIFIIIIFEVDSGISEGLINFSFEGSQGLLFSFNPIKFTPEVFSDIPSIFQEDVSLSGILLLVTFDFSRIIGDI